MAIFETFSKRQKRLKGQMKDVFTYDDIPNKLRIQICHIWMQAFGIEKQEYVGLNPIYPELERTLAAEFGLFGLGDKYEGVANVIIAYFVQTADTEQALDMIETSFTLLWSFNREFRWRDAWHQQISMTEAIDDLNKRFLEHSVGYAIVEGAPPQLIRKDNEHLHQDVVLPALRLLHENGFSGANDEYRKAHEHYRNGRQKECLNECLKAFESTMKTICTKKRWAHNQTDTARQLIDVCLNNGLLPSFMQTHLGTVKSALESAIPTVRNKLGGHGQGLEPIAIPPFYAEYLLHETAASIVFLIEAYRASEHVV